MSCKPEGPCPFQGKLLDPGRHRRENHPPQPASPPAAAEPPRGRVQPRQRRLGTPKAPPELRVSPPLPNTHFAPWKSAGHSFIPFNPAPSPERDQRSSITARSRPASFRQEGKKERGPGRRNTASPFFFSFFFPPHFPPSPPQKTERQTANDIIAEMWRVIIAIQKLIIHIKQGEASFSFACLRLYAFQKSFPRGI